MACRNPRDHHSLFAHLAHPAVITAFPFLLPFLVALAGPIQAQPMPAPAPKAAPGPAAPSGPADPKEERKIPGLAWARKDGRWLGLTREAGHLVVRFYDEKKKPEKADLSSASAHWKAPLDLHRDSTRICSIHRQTA